MWLSQVKYVIRVATIFSELGPCMNDLKELLESFRLPYQTSSDDFVISRNRLSQVKLYSESG